MSEADVEKYFLLFHNSAIPSLPFVNTSVWLDEETILKYAIKYGLAHAPDATEGVSRPVEKILAHPHMRMLAKHLDFGQPLKSYLISTSFNQPDIIPGPKNVINWTGSYPLLDFMEKRGFALHEFSTYRKGIGKGMFVPAEFDALCSDITNKVIDSYYGPHSQQIYRELGLMDIYENHHRGTKDGFNLMRLYANQEGLQDLLWIRVAHRLLNAYREYRIDLEWLDENGIQKIKEFKQKPEFAQKYYDEYGLAGFGVAFDAFKGTYNSCVLSTSHHLPKPELLAHAIPSYEYSNHLSDLDVVNPQSRLEAAPQKSEMLFFLNTQ